jgi:hypothetical protein
MSCALEAAVFSKRVGDMGVADASESLESVASHIQPALGFAGGTERRSSAEFRAGAREKNNYTS